MLHIHNRILSGLDKDEKENLNKIDGYVKDIQSKVAHCQNGQCLKVFSHVQVFTHEYLSWIVCGELESVEVI